MRDRNRREDGEPSRRDFLRAAGIAGAGIAARGQADASAAPAEGRGPQKGAATIRGAFLYPPTESLRKAGYYSWPGSSFDAESRHREYLQAIQGIERKLGARIVMEEAPLDEVASVTAFIAGVKASKPDGLLLIPLKKGHWVHVIRIVEETGVPAVVLATLGILLVDHIVQLHRRRGAYLINSLDNLEAVAYGMRMIVAKRAMAEALIANIGGTEVKEKVVPHLGTRVRAVPLDRFVEALGAIEPTGAVKELADAYEKGAREIVQPTSADILDAARSYFALKRIIEGERADAVMMNCLPGLQRPHRHPPPCMGFMSLRDEGIPAGCQSDLSATLTLMLVQHLFEKPGFQQNASMETEKNHYFGAHCTCASKLGGLGAPSEPYILMSHAEAGWGCVPRVLWRPGEKVTIAQYLPREKPEMHIYSGEVVGCPPIPRTGGCRTNVEIAIDGVADACDVLGMHQVICYGNYAKELRAFCQLYGIEVVT